MAVSSTARSFLRDFIITHFPPECSYCFAYGSGVFLQKNQSAGKMVDLIFIVDDPIKWHTKNLAINSSHYSGIRHFGPKFISNVQERMACGIYYNPFVKINDTLIKYGVMSTASLLDDLANWTHIYVAGRLHKPVLDLVPPSSVNLQTYLLKNREGALRTALLLNSRYLRKIDLYYTITELSYMGDFRMTFGEHPDKVKNIVGPLVPYFDQIYYPLIEKLKPYVKIDKTGIITQDVDPNGRLYQLMGLPYRVQRSLAKRIHRDPRVHDVEEAMLELSHLPDVSPYLRKTVSDTVWSSSILQTVQGILTAGVTRSIRYGFEKIMKKVSASRTPSATPPPSTITTQELSPPLEDKMLEENTSKSSSVPSKDTKKSTTITAPPSPPPSKEVVPISDSESKTSGRKPRKSTKDDTARVTKSKRNNNNNHSAKSQPVSSTENKQSELNEA